VPQCRQSAAGQSRTVYAKVVERSRDLDLGLEIEIGIGKLFAFAQCALCMQVSGALYPCRRKRLAECIVRSSDSGRRALSDVPMILNRLTLERKSPTGAYGDDL
jgi:hypothetical protein